MAHALGLAELLVLIGRPAVAAHQSHLPDKRLNLQITAPIQTWDEAIPLGNGAMRVLPWGEGGPQAR